MIIGMTFPKLTILQSVLEPSILSVLPDKDAIFDQFNLTNWPRASVSYFLCSVFIAGYQEFFNWAKHYDKSKIIVGGYHPTCCPEDFKEYAHKIVTGPCDDIQPTILQSGQIIKGITNNNMPRLDLYDYALSKQCVPDLMPYHKLASLNTGFGCKYRCNFCCTPLMYKKLVNKSIAAVEKELDLIRQFILPNFLFIKNENFIQQMEWREYLDKIRLYFPFAKLYCFSTSSLLNAPTIRYLSERNMHMICIGLENIFDSYAKNHFKHLANIARLLRLYNIKLYMSYIVDPMQTGSTEAENKYYEKLADILKILKPDMITANFLMPFPGTLFWNKYSHLISKADYKYYDSKTPFIIRNKTRREQMQYNLYKFQWDYYTSDFYNKNVRKFNFDDTLGIRFAELKDKFQLYEEQYGSKQYVF